MKNTISEGSLGRGNWTRRKLFFTASATLVATNLPRYAALADTNDTFTLGADEFDLSAVLEKAFQKGARNIRFQHGVSYHFDKTVAIPSGTRLSAGGACFSSRTNSGPIFDLTDASDVVFTGGHFELGRDSAANENQNATGAAFGLCRTRNLLLRNASFSSAPKGVAIVEQSPECEKHPSVNCYFKNLIFRNGAGIFASNLQHCSFENLKWRGEHPFCIAINSDDHHGVVLAGLKFINLTCDSCSRIAFEIKHSVGMYWKDVEVKDSAQMAFSFPNASKAYIVRPRIGGVRSQNGYGLEIVGDCSGTTICEPQISNVAGAAIHFTMSDFGYAHGCQVTGGKISDCANGIVLFRGKRCTKVELAHEIKNLIRGDTLTSPTQSLEVVGIGNSGRTIYLASVQPLAGRSLPQIKLQSGDIMRSVDGNTAQVISVVEESGADVAALTGWSRGNNIIIRGVVFRDSPGICEFESGVCAPQYIGLKQFLATKKAAFIRYRSENYLIENCVQILSKSAPSNGSSFVGDMGATFGRIVKNTIYANGVGVYAFDGYGKDVYFVGNVVHDDPGEAFVHDREKVSFKIYRKNFLFGPKGRTAVKSPFP